MMIGSTADRNPFERLAEEFAERLRRGEHPAIADYVALHPEHADDIRDLFPEIAAVEQCKPSDFGSKTSSPTAMAAAPTRLPDQLGDYRIVRYLGAGGMGVVYEAVRESLRNNVALKVMHPQFRDREQYERRFRTEARSAARLHHTNIVSVFDYGVHDGVCYYAMQYIAGHSLDKILAEVRQLRREKDVVVAGEAPATALDTQASSRSEPWLTPSQPGEAPTCASSRALSLGLVTGAWSVTASTPGSADQAGQPAPGTTVALNYSGIAPPPEDNVEKRVQRTALQMLAAELAASNDNPKPAATHGPGAADRLTTDLATLSGSGSSLTTQGEVRYYREIARLGAQVADALAHAHKRGVLHRDIKPSNLILDGLGNIWITDFGLAKFEDADDLSHSQDLVGTLRFMAPERFRGVSDPRCDVYALGATLYEMVTLRPCFSGQSHAQLIHRIEHEPPVPPRQIERGIPADLETIVLKALAKAPGDRFENADEMGAELRRYLENRPIRSRPIPAYQRFWRWCKRNPALATAGMTAAAATIALAIVSSLAARNYSDQVQALKVEQQQTKLAEHKALRELGNSLVTEGAALQRSGLVGQRFESLRRLERAAQILRADPESRHRLPEIRDHVIAGLGLVDLRIRFEREVGIWRSLAIDNALERYAFCAPSGEMVICRLDEGEELSRLSVPGRRDSSTSWGAVFSPDGDLLVTIDRSPTAMAGIVTRIWDLDRRAVVAELESTDSIAFDHAGRRLAFGAPDGGIAVWDRNERRVVRRLPLDFPPGPMAFDPEGRRLAVATRDGAAPRVVILEADSGQVLVDWRTQVGNHSPSWSADGQLLAVGGFGGEDPHVYVLNVRRKTLQSVLQGHTKMVDHLSFAHSGYLLATHGHDAATRLWDAASGECLVVAPGRNYCGFSADDRRLAFTTGWRIGVWDISTAPERQTLHAGMTGNRTERRVDGGVQAAEFSPDATLLATAADDGVRLWDGDSGREIAHLNAGKCRSVLFDSDGSGVITCSRSGAYRWPIRPDSMRGPDAISMGPPELLWERLSDNEFACASWLPDRRTLAIIDNARRQVVLVDTRSSHPAESRAIPLEAANQSMTSLAVSPDGRWLAAGSWYAPGITVWDVLRHRFERILTPPDAKGITKFFVSFSPDGRWLVSSTLPDNSRPAYHFWRPGTWDLDRRIDNDEVAVHAAFTRDSAIMALCKDHKVTLADATTGRELARLSTVQQDDPTPLSFSPDGTKLVVGISQNTAHVWDLRRVREMLTTMGLDWEAPPYPAASEADRLRPPRPVRVLGEVLETEARRARELADMDRRIAADPDDALALIHRGWLRLNLSQPAQAVADLERSVRLRPDDDDSLFLLAEAYSHGNNLPAALQTLESYLARRPDDIGARAKKGLLAHRLQRLPEALIEYNRVLEADPSRVPVRVRRAQVLLRLRQFAEALADLNTLIERFPEDPSLFELRSKAHDGLGDREHAQADRQHAATLPQGSAYDFNDLAWRLATGPVAMRDPEQALAAARRAIELEPRSTLYLNTLGVAQFRAGLYKEAIDTLQKSLAAGKGEADAFDLYFLAMARQKIGDIAGARDDFNRAAQWHRTHPNASTVQWKAQLEEFNAEAEAALSAPLAPLPNDVFGPPTKILRGP
jgi:serine/threonine protein kinase/WD40 repeat protein/tetratricopeptide (TPR) repeat protein